MRSLFVEIGYAAKAFRSWRLLSAAVVLTLAIGIGSTTTMFSVVDAVLLSPLPYENADRIVLIWQRVPGANVAEDWLSPGQFKDIAEQSSSFEELALFSGGRTLLNRRAPGEDVGFLVARSSFFRVMGARAQLGRVLAAEDDRPGAERVVVLTHELWHRRYGGDPAVVGELVGFEHLGFEVVGVLEPGFELDSVLPVPGSNGRHDMIFSLPLSEEELLDRHRENFNVIGKLRVGRSEAHAQAELDVIASRMRERDLPKINDASFHLDVVPLIDQVVGPMRRGIWILLSAAGTLLLLACVNVANLLLMRAAARERELGLCAALGANRGRVVARLLVEGALLSIAGGVLGILLAAGGVALLRTFGAQSLPRLSEVHVDGRVLFFALVVSAVVSVAFGLAPARRAGRVDPVSALKGTHFDASTLPKRFGLTSGFAVAQLALAFILLVGAGLLIQSYVRLQQVDPGFDAGGRLSLRITPPPDPERSDEESRALTSELLRTVRALPGVRDAATGTPLPFGQGVAWGPIHVDGFERAPDEPVPVVDRRFVSPGYFRTMGIRLVAGRSFDARDTAPDARAVRIVDRPFAERFWPDQDPLGRVIGGAADEALDPGDERAIVVGVVEHVRHANLEAQGRMTIYAPRVVGRTYLVVHADGDPNAQLHSVTDAVRTVAPGVVISDARTMPDRLRDATAERRLMLALMQGFGLVAWFLAAVGLYGVVAHGVMRGTPEIGMRMALGADRRNIVRLVLRHGFVVIALGLSTGGLMSLLGARFLESLLFAVDVVSPTIFAGIACLLAATSLVASWVPARLAARIDPVLALRL